MERLSEPHLRDRLPTLVLLLVHLAVAVHLDAQMRRERVHDGHPDAVQAAGHLVSGAAELAAGVKDRVHHLERGLPGLFLDVGRDAAAVVGDGDVVIRVDRHVDAVARAVHRLVDRVVEDLAYEVMETTQIGGADVHARPAAYGLEALEDLDVGGAV